MKLVRDPKACADVLKRENQQDRFASEKTRYLAWLQVESAMALVDCVTLAGNEVAEAKPDRPHLLPVEHERYKTGKIARPALPKFLWDEMCQTFKWDSEKYPFWSGEGDPENRGQTYRDRIKKLFIAAGIRVHQRLVKKKSGGKTKDEPELVLDSHADPHFWRHTWVRDAYILKIAIEEIAKYLGDSVAAVEDYYSCFDELRHASLMAEADKVSAMRQASYLAS
jgi:hypothetical protein